MANLNRLPLRIIKNIYKVGVAGTTLSITAYSTKLGYNISKENNDPPFLRASLTLGYGILGVLYGAGLGITWPAIFTKLTYDYYTKPLNEVN